MKKFRIHLNYCVDTAFEFKAETFKEAKKYAYEQIPVLDTYGSVDIDIEELKEE